MCKQYKLIWIYFFIAAFGFSGCSDVLDIEPDDVLVKDAYYQNRYDAEAAMKGIYGQFMELSEQLVVLNELRADLMDITPNSNQDLRDINEHNVSEGNKYADPLPFYKVISNCNDALANYERMFENKLLLEEDYVNLYSEVAAIRTWIYLQVGIHYGNIPYITKPIENVADASEVAVIKDEKDVLVNAIKQDTTLQVIASEKRISLDDLVLVLIEFMNTKIPQTESFLNYSRYTADLDVGGITETFHINKFILAGDLNLWAGNYTVASMYYKNVMTYPTGGDRFNKYKISYIDPEDNLKVYYQRHRESDILSLETDKTKGWRSIFTKNDDAKFFEEWVWAIEYDDRFEVENPFISLFANQGVGEYLVGPSEQVYTYWNNQMQSNQVDYDSRSVFSVSEIDGQKVITKFIDRYDPIDIYKRQGYWYLYRTAQLHLRFCEAANRDGQSRVAYALLNHGIKTEYNADSVDITYLQRTNLPFPYDFDGRQSGLTSDKRTQIPVGLRGTYYRNCGIRNRANLESHNLLEEYNLRKDDTEESKVELVQADSISIMEELILEEAALELAFEGHRWEDLVRIAKRNNDPSILANKVAAKFSLAGKDGDAIHDILMNEDNWYLPFPSMGK